jgi:HK97 family phage prohead protease
MTMERKTFPVLTTKVDRAQGIVESIVAGCGNVDLGGDRIKSGAFTKTITERGPKIRCLDAHNTDSIMRVIGKPLAMRELRRDELPPEMLQRFPEMTGGLWVQTQFLMDTPEGKGAFIRLAEGAVDEWSIGYEPSDLNYVREAREGKAATVREIGTIKLYEYSPVLFGMNEAPQTLSAKEATKMDKTNETPAGKAADFATIMANRQQRENLRDQRWKMDMALSEAIDGCMMDSQMGADTKMASIGASLDQYKAAMMDWCTRAMPMMQGQEGESGAMPMAMMAARLGISTKAGRRNSSADEQAMRRVMDLMDEAMGHMRGLVGEMMDGGEKADHADGDEEPDAADQEALKTCEEWLAALTSFEADELADLPAETLDALGEAIDIFLEEEKAGGHAGHRGAHSGHSGSGGSSMGPIAKGAARKRVLGALEKRGSEVLAEIRNMRKMRLNSPRSESIRREMIKGAQSELASVRKKIVAAREKYKSHHSAKAGPGAIPPTERGSAGPGATPPTSSGSDVALIDIELRELELMEV